MQDNIFIRAADTRDQSIIVDFNCRLAKESENLTLDQDIISRGVLRGLTTPTLACYFLATIHDQVVGQCMINYELTDWRDGLIWWLHSVYVVPEARGKGVFQKLLTHITELASADSSFRGLRLYVEKENHRAIAIYEKSGFSKSYYHLMERWPKKI